MRRVEIEPCPAFEEFPLAATEGSIAQRFRERARRRAGCDAIRTATQRLTYEELDGRSGAVACMLLDALGQGSEPVAVLAANDICRVAALLGILKAGKFFILLDPSHPPARVAQVLEDSGARLVLRDDAGRAPGVRSIDVEHVTPRNAALAAAEVAPDAPACILYTSGSTGRPKGILHSQRNLLFNVLRNTRSLKFSPDDRVALLGSRTMAQATHTTFNALLNGACLHPVDLRAEGFATLERRLRMERVTVYNSSASIFRRFARDAGRLESLRIVRLGSEPISRADVDAWKHLAPERSWFVAALSSTETGTIRQLVVDRGTELASSLVPSGFAVDGAEVEIVDEDGHALPPGSPGRIAVSSRYLALEYWRRPELTEAAFHPDPKRAGNRVFLMGDRGRLDADGCLHHLGRIDDQLKISGNRVEPAEVEATLLEHPDVRQAVVVARENAVGETRLVAHVAADDASAQGLKAFLRERLPAPMIPSGIVVQRELPLTAAGKVDRTGLPPWPAPRGNASAEEPHDLLQGTLTRIWEDVLGLRPVGLREDFFELGGDSLMAVELLGRIEEACCRSLPASVLTRGATVESVAAALSGEVAADGIVEVQRGANERPFFFHSGDMTGAAFYCRRLAREIGPDVPFHAIPSHGADGRRAPDTIEEMVSDRLPELLAIQPRGPYRLGGYCHGGVFAYEMARRLVAMGHRVDALILVEATHRAPYARALRRLDRLVPESLRDEVRRGKALLRRMRGRLDDAAALREQGRGAQVRDVAAALSRRVRAASRRRTTPEDRLGTLYLHYQAVLESYLPGGYPGRLVVLRAAEARVRDRALPLAGWGPFADHVEVLTVPGDHHTCVTGHASELAAVLRRFLQ